MKKKRNKLTWTEFFLALPGVLLAGALSLVIIAGIESRVRSSDGPGLLYVHFCCAILPSFALVFGIGALIKARLREDRPLFVVTPIHLMIVATIATLICIGFAAWPKPAPAPTTIADPATRARALAREAVVKRLSTLGVEGMQLEARQITRGGTPYWRVTTRGGAGDYVIDVGEGNSPVVEVFEVAAAPLEDVEAPQGPEGTAPVSSR